MVLTLVDDESGPVEMTDLIHELKVATDALEDAKRAKDYWQRRVEEELVAREEKTETVPYDKDDTKSLRAVRVSNRRFRVDTTGLIKKFGKRAVNPVLKDPEVDKAKLDAALKDPESGFTKEGVVDYVHYDDHPFVRLYLVERKEAVDDLPEE
jgi:hypothetical protein